MTKFIKSKLAKASLGLAVAVTLVLGSSNTAFAQTPTVADLQAQIAQLQALIAQLSGSTGGSTSTASYDFGTATLRVGSKGMYVSNLQSFLNAKIGAGLTVDGNFGPATAAKVASWQAANGLSADGVFGPASMAKAKSMGGSTGSTGGNTGGTTGTGTTLSGTEGDLTFDVILDSDVDLDLGETEVVLEFEAEAEDGDVLVDRIDFFFESRPWLYFDEVKLLADDKEIASLSDEDDFTEDGSEYRARFSGLDYVIEEDETVVFGIEVTVLDSLVSSRLDDTVVLDTVNASMRYMDGSGAIMTSDDLASAEVDITFTDNFGEGDMTVTLGDDSPESETIVLNEDSRTNGVTVLEFNIEAEESDIEVTDITVEFSSNASSVADTLYKAYLYNGSDLIDSKSVTANTVVFDDLEFMIDEDDTEEFTVKVDFNDTDGIGVDTFTVVEAVVDAEDEDFVALTDTLSVGETHQLVVEGLVEDFDTKSATTSSLGDDTIARFSFTFDLTAYEDDFYIAEDGSGFAVTLDNGDATIVTTTIADTDATLTAEDSYRISKGQTETFTVEVEVAAGVTGTPVAVIATIDTLEYFTASDMLSGDDTLTLGAPDYRSASRTVIDAN